MGQEDAIKIHHSPSPLTVMAALMAKTVYLHGNKIQLVCQDVRTMITNFGLPL